VKGNTSPSLIKLFFTGRNSSFPEKSFEVPEIKYYYDQLNSTYIS